mmetsp:Transcript_2659/g.6682  ORF Transcript_2659/g.6682 Transcript_2659/m.6682 type:complete len:267 (-) Transcript_2659:214-1014(-)
MHRLRPRHLGHPGRRLPRQCLRVSPRRAVSRTHRRARSTPPPLPQRVPLSRLARHARHAPLAARRARPGHARALACSRRRRLWSHQADGPVHVALRAAQRGRRAPPPDSARGGRRGGRGAPWGGAALRARHGCSHGHVRGARRGDRAPQGGRPLDRRRRWRWRELQGRQVRWRSWGWGLQGHRSVHSVPLPRIQRPHHPHGLCSGGAGSRRTRCSRSLARRRPPPAPWRAPPPLRRSQRAAQPRRPARPGAHSGGSHLAAPPHGRS